MKNILYISPDISVKGGISSVIKGYLSTELPQKHKIILVSSHIDGPKLVKMMIAALGLIKTLYHLMYKNIEIVHIHGSDTTSSKRKYFYFKLARIYNRKIIYHFHGASFMDMYPKLSKRWKARLKELFEKSDLVICLSENWKKNILSIAPGANIVVIENAVNLPNLTHKEATENYVHLVFLGLIGARKGIFDLLKVVKRLVDDGIPIKVSIGGNGEIDRLHREISSLGIDQVVKYLGWISEKERDSLLRNTGIYILPSYGEGLPMSILEAMSYGVPVISTFVGGIPEVVIDGETGFLVEPGNLDMLYEKLKTLIFNSEQRISFGIKGREVIEKKYNLYQTQKKIDEIYNTL